ncbi:ArsR/SmtB family transcription factor [Chloroflexota bacterium]
MELRVKFDSEDTWAWQCLGDGRDIRQVEAETRILEVIETLGEADAKDIAEDLGISRPTIYAHLKRMRSEGRVGYEKVETASGVRMRYKLPQETRATTPTRLLCEIESDISPTGGSRQVGEVGADSKVTNEEVTEWMRELLSKPEGGIFN